MAIWYILRKRTQKKIERRYYVRPVHVEDTEQRMRIFWRYYKAESPLELKQFCNFTPALFDQLFTKISTHFNVDS
jgi:hypothetical protein